MESLGNVLVGIMGALLLVLAGAQLKSGRAFKLGRGMGPQQWYEREREPGSYWLHEGAVLVGGLVLVGVSLFAKIPLK